MRYLSVSLFLLMLGCAPSIQPRQLVQAELSCIEKFRPVFKSDWYTASVDVAGRHISGLILFKTMPDSSIRIVFTNEAGITFFDFGFLQNGVFRVYHVMKQLNKKQVIKSLQKDFELTLMRKVGKQSPVAFQQNGETYFAFDGKKETEYVITNPMCSKLIRLENGSDENKKTIARLFGSNHHAPDSIFIEHLNFKMNMRLKHFTRL